MPRNFASRLRAELCRSLVHQSKDRRCVDPSLRNARLLSSDRTVIPAARADGDLLCRCYGVGFVTGTVETGFDLECGMCFKCMAAHA